MAILRYPIFANNSDSVSLENIYTGSDFSFDMSFTAPAWLTLNSDNELEITASAVSETTPVLVKLTMSREFYLVVSPNASPTLRVS